MLSSDDRQKLAKKYKWSNAQEKANFYKNKRKYLKKEIEGLSDLVRIIKGLPPKVLENAKLADDFPAVIEFIDAFLEAIDPLPVAEHESGEIRVFQNTMNPMDGHPYLDSWEKKGYICQLNGKKYIIGIDTWTATAGEIERCTLLKNHLEKLQKYVDPSIVARAHSDRKVSILDHQSRLGDRAEILGECKCSFGVMRETENIPTKPPRQPCIIFKTEEESK